MRNSVLLLFFATLCFCAPVCNPGAQQTFTNDAAMSLDGSGSSGTGALSFAWSQLSGPTTPSFSSASVSKPTLSGPMSFGSYVFQLIVTDNTGSSTCTVKDGYVLSDSNGVVLTRNSTVDALLGPMIRYGANPWPWEDDRHKAAADFNNLHLSDWYSAFWARTQGPGTVSLTSGSATVTGSGTDFTTRFCQGPGSPTVPLQAGGTAVSLLLWYPNSSVEGYGLRSTQVASCTSDTVLTLAEVWPNDVSDCHAGGCNYSYDDNTVGTISAPLGQVWLYPEKAGSNYYDAVDAFYALYYRSGIDDYLTAARTLADRDWKYRLDSGMACRFGGVPVGDRCGAGIDFRTWSLNGMFLRASDSRPDMWSGLEHMLSYTVSCITVDDVHWGVYDIREQAYELAVLSYGSLFDPTPANRATYQSTISTMMSVVWYPAQLSDGSWQTIFVSGGSWSGSQSVSLTNGSTDVDGTGSAIDFTAVRTEDGSWSDHPAATNHIVFFSGTSEPASNASMESTYYTASLGAAHHLTLDRPYSGITGSHGWMLGYGFCPNNCFVGYGTLPYMIGILGFAFDMASKAVAASDPVNAARARQYVSDIAVWESKFGYRVPVKGMYYVVNTVDCQYPISESATWCTGAMIEDQARTLSAESLRSITAAYKDTGSPALLAFGNQLYNAMYAKPGTCGASPLCSSDGKYVDLWDDGAWFIQPPPGGTPYNNRWHKYFGMSFGIGAGADWPAALVAGSSMRPIIGAGTVLGTGVVR